MNANFEWEKDEDRVFLFGNSLKAATFRTDSQIESTQNLKTCIYTHVLLVLI
jgi:hypothetical protein